MIEEQLLRERVVCLRGPLGDEQANLVIAKLLFLQFESRLGPITLLIDSPGGSVTAAMAVHDTIEYVSAPVWTCCDGNAHGTAAMLLSCGPRGERTIVRGSTVSLTPVTAAAPGVADSNLEKTSRLLAGIIAKATGQSVESVQADMLSGRSFDPVRAVVYGLADRVVE